MQAERVLSFIKRLSLFIAAGSIVLGLAAGCSSDSSDSADTGQVVIGVTDAEGDFLNYTVDVVSLTLTKANGAVVETLPVDTRVDFSQYTDMTEFLTAATVPAGVYTSAVLTLDYSDAEIWVEDAGGTAVQAVSILDENGDPLDTLELEVSLDGHESLTIVRGVPASLTLDFDLAASNSVSFAGGGATVTVSPFLQAGVNVDVPDIHRVRGPLETGSVDVAGGTFQVIIRPFIHAISTDRRFGVLDVHADAETVYEINGETYQGEAGLEQLAAMPAYTAIIVMGSLTTDPLRFEADQVYAGSSVPGGTSDVIWGNVIARSGNTLTIRGGTLLRTDGSVVFNDEMTVLLGEDTRVRRQLSPEAGSIGDISVGQRIHVFGSADEEGDEIVLDATEGTVHLMLTTLRGTVVATASGEVRVDLQAVDGRDVDLFNFTGTGGDASSDADPGEYEVDTAALDTSSLAVGTPVRIRGLVTPFGEAPDDFAARTIVNVTEVPAVMHVTWVPATGEALTDLSDSGFSLNLTGVGLFHHVTRAGVSIDLTGLGEDASVVPAGSGGLFALVDPPSWQFFTEFPGFAGDLEEELDGGAGVRSLFAVGIFDDDAAVLEASLIELRIH
jgi:hypothetical protein